MVLFNPLTDFTDSSFMRVVIGGEALTGSNKQAQPVASQEQLALAQRLSPLFRVRPGLPPTLLLHGTADKVIDPSQSIQLERALSRLGNHCELQLLAGLPHAFVIPAYKSPPAVVVDALSRADHFLVSLGFLSGEFPLKALPSETWPR
jgi:acetyl esterase/lipase